MQCSQIKGGLSEEEAKKWATQSSPRVEELRWELREELLRSYVHSKPGFRTLHTGLTGDLLKPY